MADVGHWPLYPDIQVVGGLGPALEAEFARLGVALPVRCFGAGSWARVEAGAKSCEPSLALRLRLISFSCWADGVSMGSLSTPDLSICAEAIAAWVSEGVGVAVMSHRFSAFRASEGAEAFEQGRGVDWAWMQMGSGWASRDLPRLTPLIEAAKRRPELRQLLPFTSHETLHFSRCTGYPYTDDVAHANPLGDGLYRALRPGYRMVHRMHRVEATGKEFEWDEADYDVQGEGDAEYVVGLIVANLPDGCGPAVRGTARDLTIPSDDAVLTRNGDERR